MPRNTFAQRRLPVLLASQQHIYEMLLRQISKPQQNFQVLSSTMSSNRHLRIFSDETGDVQQAELSVNSTRHRTAELPIDLGLRVHETPEGKDFLVMFAIKFIKAREKKKKRHTYGDRSFDEMPQWIDYFLTILRRDFPHVYLRKMEGEGMVVRYNWGDSMTSYDPTVAAELSLNRTVCFFS